MRLYIDPMKDEPVFQQLIDQVKQAMVSGVLSPGDKLPTVRECAADLLINPNTVQKAYQELIREGLIYSRKGMGNFVAPFGDERQKTMRQAELQRLLDAFWTEARLSGYSKQEIRELINQFIDRGGEHE